MPICPECGEIGGWHTTNCPVRRPQPRVKPGLAEESVRAIIARVREQIAMEIEASPLREVGFEGPAGIRQNAASVAAAIARGEN